jgi:hypothetical protein
MTRTAAILGLIAALPLLACSGSTPTSPGPTCEPVTTRTSTTLSVGDLFRFRFTVPAAADADVLVTFMGEGGSGLMGSAMTLRLYDGPSLLGAVEGYQDTVAFWKSTGSRFGDPGNPYGIIGPAAVVDFRTIVSGTIDGRVEFSVTQGTPRVDRLDLATIMVWSPTNTSGVVAPAITGRELCR